RSRLSASRLYPVVWHLRAIKHAGRFSRENSSGHQQGAAKSRRSASALNRRHPGQADAAERARRSHESGLREADERCQSIGDEAAIGLVRPFFGGRISSLPSYPATAGYPVRCSLSIAHWGLWWALWNTGSPLSRG